MWLIPDRRIERALGHRSADPTRMLDLDGTFTARYKQPRLAHAESPLTPMTEAQTVQQHRPFVLYWSARTCASMGFQMLGVAVGWQMYALTGSAFDLGLVGLAQFLPAAAFMLVAGQIADRYDRRRLLQIFQTVEAFSAALLATGAQLGFASKELLLAAVLIFGVGRAFELPDAADAIAVGSAAQAISQRSGGFVLDHAARHHLRSRARRVSLRAWGGNSLHPLLPALSRLGRAAHLRAHGTVRAVARADQPFGVLRRRLLHSPQSDRARRDLARPVRGAAGRNDGAVADLRQRGARHRLARARPAAGVAGDRRAGDHAGADPPAADPARRPHHVHERRLLRGRHRRIRAVETRSRSRWWRWRCWAPRTRSAS